MTEDHTIATPRRVRRDRLLREVRSHLAAIFDGDLCAVVADTGGAGLCRHATAELIERMGRGRAVYLDLYMGFIEYADGAAPEMRADLPLWAYRYFRGPDDVADYGHVVAEIDGYYIDLTAQQFRRRLPFPMIVRVGEP